MNRQSKNAYYVKERWYGRNTKVNPRLKSGRRNAEYNIELLKSMYLSRVRYIVHESWGVIGKPSKVSIMIFQSKKKAEAYFLKEIEVTASHGYKKTNSRIIKY